MSLQELAQFKYQGLKKEAIEVGLSGGACVSIYTDNAYQSGDLDFIRQGSESFERVSAVMIAMGFKNHGRHFTHPDSEFFVEFPRPPLTVGEGGKDVRKTSPLQGSAHQEEKAEMMKNRSYRVPPPPMQAGFAK